jgi:hypothetical protein
MSLHLILGACPVGSATVKLLTERGETRARAIPPHGRRKDRDSSALSALAPGDCTGVIDTARLVGIALHQSTLALA